MVNRFMTAQSTAAMRRWGQSAIVTLAAMALLSAFAADATAKQPHSAPVAEADSSLSRQVDDDLERAFAATFDRSIEAETPAQGQQRTVREEARSRAMSDAIEGAVRGFIAADGPDRATQVKARVLRKIMASAPETATATYFIV